MAEGGQLQFQHVQPVEQILAERTLLHLRGQIFIGGSDNPYIHWDHRVATYADDLVFLEHPEQLPLELGRDIADLIQKKGAPVCDLKEACLAALHSSGKSPFHMAK